MKKLAVLIAKSGVSLLEKLPKDWEVVIADYSRLDQREVKWWNQPRYRRYQEIIIIDRNITTALTQRKLEQELRKKGVKGPVRYAGNPKTLLAYWHLDYLLTKEGLVPKLSVKSPPSEIYDFNRYMIALVGLPATGKTLLRYLFSRWQGFSVYKWGVYLRIAIEKVLGPMTSNDSWEKVRRFTQEIESQDRTIVARTFIEHSGVRSDPATFVVIDGIKSREQIIYISYTLKRPVIIVAVKRNEKERQREALKRGDPDDYWDAERLEILREMGALDVIEFGDFVVETTGCATIYNESKRICQIKFTKRFLSNLHEVLSWISNKNTMRRTKKLVCQASREVAEARGFKGKVKIIP